MTEPATAASTTGSSLTADNQKIWEAGPQTFVDDRVQTILDLLPHLGPEATIVDIGCLDGTLTRLYAEKVGTKNVHGVDVALNDTAAAKGITVTPFDLNSIEPLPFPDARFDIVLCVETLEHVYPTDHLLAEIIRVLKPGGTAVIDVPRLDSFLNIGLLILGFQPPGVECSRVRRYGSINNDSVLTGHVAYFTRRALLEMIEGAGFQIRHVRQVGQRSGWMKLQETQGKRVTPLVRLIWWIYDALSLKKEYLVVVGDKPIASR
jgi:ubiquinone/menaquinone biosynthesis C-methylase UbiE